MLLAESSTPELVSVLCCAELLVAGAVLVVARGSASEAPVISFGFISAAAVSAATNLAR